MDRPHSGYHGNGAGGHCSTSDICPINNAGIHESSLPGLGAWCVRVAQGEHRVAGLSLAALRQEDKARPFPGPLAREAELVGPWSFSGNRCSRQGPHLDAPALELGWGPGLAPECLKPACVIQFQLPPGLHLVHPGGLGKHAPARTQPQMSPGAEVWPVGSKQSTQPPAYQPWEVVAIPGSVSHCQV